MKPKIISFTNLKSWINKLIEEYPVYAPIEKDKDFDYKKIKNSSEIAFNFDRTRMSVKDYFFKPEETIFTASVLKGKPQTPVIQENTKIIFAIRPCDISALNLFDRVFSEPYPDPYYWTRRDKHIIIGLRCIEKCRTCFCGTMNSFDPKTGYDIFLTYIDNESYFVEGGTEKGRVMLNKNKELFSNITDQEIIFARDTFHNIEEIFRPNHISVSTRAIVDLNLDRENLIEYEKICLSCGQCTYVCPTCWCYNVRDIIASDLADFGNLDKTERIRQWTSCLLRQFHTISGKPPHVFKKNVSSRLEAWYNHKLRGIPKHYGVLGCVGCGRCYSSCPVGIDVRESLSVITGGIFN